MPHHAGRKRIHLELSSYLKTASADLGHEVRSLAGSAYKYLSAALKDKVSIFFSHLPSMMLCAHQPLVLRAYLQSYTLLVLHSYLACGTPCSIRSGGVSVAGAGCGDVIDSKSHPSFATRVT